MILLSEKYIRVLIITLTISLWSGIIKSEDVFDVTKFGADTKGVNTSSDAITKAIDEAVKNGGGTVLFPNGIYLTSGPIHLKSNITLSLESGSIINFSDNFDDYLPMVPMRWEGTEVVNFSPLIYAYKQENIVIKGKGVLDGQGSKWLEGWEILSQEYAATGNRTTKYQDEFVKHNNLTELQEETVDMSRLNVAFLRPPFIQTFESNNILIQDVTIENSPFWNINPVFCNNITIEGVKIRAPAHWPNTDGIDPDSCKDVLIRNVDIDVGDDCIVLKSGRDLQARRRGRPTENVFITNSVLKSGNSGVGVGSEMSGGVRNITVTNCEFNGTNKGLMIKSVRGRGGVVEDIHFRNITMIGIQSEAIDMTQDYTPTRTGHNPNPPKPEPFSDRTPVFRNIDIQNITVLSANTAITLLGIEESLLSDVTIRDIEITSRNGVTVNYTNNLQLIGFSNKISKAIK